MHERDIFDAALALADPAERSAYLAEACAGDPGLRQHLEGLLQMHQQLGSFLEAPAPVATVDDPIRERPGTVIGPYKLLEQIGEGGFGVVFMAEQAQPVRRKVALKVLKPGMDTHQVVARFEAERQALAIMDHPNIAKVFDGGATDSGRPYFVMELVKGVSITEYCDRNHLTPRQRLELLLPVCAAVQHAHQKGIIHRDLKPANVLVTMHDTVPVVKVIDFGVAKALGQELTDRTLFTGFAQMIGTPLYMSPEQAGQSGLDVDTRSDIYSLGVLLYELLTGTTPFPKERFKTAAYDEIRRIIREEEPPRPSTRLSDSKDSLPSISAQRQTEPAKLARLVRGELDWIVMKCLEKDRNRRYDTVNNFAADVQRYLADEPVQACPPSAAYRFRKFARRNTRALATTAVLAVAVLFAVAAVGGSVGWASRDSAARQAAVEQEATLALGDAERWRDQGRWPETLSAAKRAEGLLAGGGSAELRERARQLRKDMELVLRLDVIPLLASALRGDKYDHEAADRAYAQAFADYGVDVAHLPTEEAVAHLRARAGVAVALAAALDHWVSVRRVISGTDVTGWKRLVAVARGIDPDPVRDRIRSAWGRPIAEVQDDLRRLADSIDVRTQHPATLLSLALTLKRVKHADSALRILRDAQRINPGDFWINVALADELWWMGASYLDEVVAFRRAALAIRPQSAALHNDLGAVLLRQGKRDEAIACYRRAIELDPQAAHPQYNLGRALSLQKKLSEAIICFRRAIEINPRFAKAHSQLGNALFDSGKPDEGIAFLRKAIKIDPNYAEGYVNLGYALRQVDKDEAIAAYQQAIKLGLQDATAYSNLALALVKLNDPNKLPEAVTAAEMAIKINPKFADAYNVLGLAFAYQKKLVEAAAAYQKAIDLDPRHPHAHANLGSVFGRLGKYDQAIACCRRALLINRNDTNARRILRMTLRYQGWELVKNPDPKLRDPKRAGELAKEAVGLAPQDSIEWQYLGWIQYRAGNWKACIEALEESCKLEKGGDAGQWIVMSLAHARLGAQSELPEKARASHMREARRRFDQADKWINSNWSVRPGDEIGQAIWEFRAEARELIVAKVSNK